MGEASSEPASNVHIITDRTTHDAAMSRAQGNPSTSFSDAVPTLLYVSSSSNPACAAAHAKVVALARANPHVQVYIMELTSQTAPMIKFGIQNTPIFILMKGMYCETVLGPDLRRVEDLVARNLGEAKGEKKD